MLIIAPKPVEGLCYCARAAAQNAYTAFRQTELAINRCGLVSLV